MGSHCPFFFLFFLFGIQVPPSRREGGGKERREEAQAGHPVCVLWLKGDGKHFYHDSAILHTDINFLFFFYSVSLLFSFFEH